MKKGYIFGLLAIVFIALVCVLSACDTTDNYLISVEKGAATRVEYYKGEEFDFNDVYVNLKYKEGTVETTTGDCNLYFIANEKRFILTVDGFDSSSETDSQAVAIKITSNTLSGELILEYHIKILPAAVVETKLEINAATRKTLYQVGDEFDPTGINVKTIYTDKTETIIPIEKSMVSGFDTSKPISRKHMLIQYTSFGSSTLDYAVSAGEGYTSGAFAFMNDSSKTLNARFYFPTNFSRGSGTSLSMQTFTGPDGANFNISRVGKDQLNYQNYEDINEENGKQIFDSNFVIPAAAQGMTIEDVTFKKETINNLKTISFVYNFKFQLIGVNVIEKQQSFFVLRDDSLLLFVFTYPPNFSDATEDELAKIETDFSMIMNTLSVE
ncbi:MAG: bacterial Ig-like domain-containing protein [Christensenellaceae bacterium]|nr:bacterial Ig-like domain-containing protein [Christensenellaceae bacterium]